MPNGRFRVNPETFRTEFIEDEQDEFDQKMERVDAVVKLGNRAAHIIADEIHKSVSRAVTAGTEHALNEMRQLPELEGFDTTKVINILRRDVCWRLADLANSAADGWDDLVFDRAIRFEPPNPDDPHGGDDPHGHQ